MPTNQENKLHIGLKQKYIKKQKSRIIHKKKPTYVKTIKQYTIDTKQKKYATKNNNIKHYMHDSRLTSRNEDNNKRK